MSHSSDWPMRLFSPGWTFALLLLLVTLPVYGPFVGPFDGTIFPVTSKVEIVDLTATPDGKVQFRFSYKKLRFCELAGVRLDIDGKTVDFAPLGSSPSYTRPTGNQVSRIWEADTPTLADAEMWFFHRCNPAWLTVTKVVP